MDRFELTSEASTWRLRATGDKAVILSARTRDEAIALACRHVMALTGPSYLRVLGAGGHVEEEYVYPRCDTRFGRVRP